MQILPQRRILLIQMSLCLTVTVILMVGHALGVRQCMVKVNRRSIEALYIEVVLLLFRLLLPKII